MITNMVVFEQWKVLFDYCCWVREGGEALYGDITIAEAWCNTLLASAMTINNNDTTIS